MQASLTGHLVFSTLHTNDAPGAMTRLVDMGVEPYLVASSLEAVLAQRLVRVICTALQGAAVGQRRWPSAAAVRRASCPTSCTRAAGCRPVPGDGLSRPARHLRNDGGHGRHPLADPRKCLGPGAAQGRQSAGHESLRDDGFRHLHDGRTTIEEILRVTKDEMFTWRWHENRIRKWIVDGDLDVAIDRTKRLRRWQPSSTKRSMPRASRWPTGSRRRTGRRPSSNSSAAA